MKTCRTCGVEWPIEDFYVSSRRGGTVRRRATCRYCWAVSQGRPVPTTRRPPSRFNGLGGVRCGMCRRFLPREAFSGTTGIVPSYCLACRRIYQARRSAALKSDRDGGGR